MIIKNLRSFLILSALIAVSVSPALADEKDIQTEKGLAEFTGFITTVLKADSVNRAWCPDYNAWTTSILKEKDRAHQLSADQLTRATQGLQALELVKPDLEQFCNDPQDFDF